MKNGVLIKRLLIGVVLLLIPIIIMTVYVKWETFYWPDSDFGELFKYEDIAEEYFEYPKDYRIEIKNIEGVIEELRLIEEIHILGGREDRIIYLKKFYQNRQESDIFNHDIVSFEYDEQDHLLRLIITVNCKDLDLNKHTKLIEFLGIEEVMEGNSLSYLLYKEKLFDMGFEKKR